MLPALADADDVTHVAHKVLATFAEPFVIDDHVLHVTASVGMSVCPEDGDDSDTLLRTPTLRCIAPKPKAATACSSILRTWEPRPTNASSSKRRCAARWTSRNSSCTTNLR